MTHEIRSGCHELLQLEGEIDKNKEEMKQRIQELQGEVKQAQKRIRQLEAQIIEEMVRQKLSCFKMNHVMFWLESPGVYKNRHEKLKEFFQTCPPSLLSTYTPDHLVEKIVTLQKKRVRIQKPETFITWEEEDKSNEGLSAAEQKEDDVYHTSSVLLSSSTTGTGSQRPPLVGYRLRKMLLPASSYK